MAAIAAGDRNGKVNGGVLNRSVLVVAQPVGIAAFFLGGTTGARVAFGVNGWGGFAGHRGR
jgi:hypothetical protein